jgi:8-oxo-dGTP pyrophosphatase MutT (NUDIX family)
MPNDKNNPSPGSIPIRTSYVCAYVYRRSSEDAQFLILKRKSSYMHGFWQQVAGKVEGGETGAAAALREIIEETGCNPKSLYSADIVEIFYDTPHNCIHIVPVFVAEIPFNAKVILSSEHSEYKWVSVLEAKRYFGFSQQRASLDIIEREFVEHKPPRHLMIQI